MAVVVLSWTIALVMVGSDAAAAVRFGGPVTLDKGATVDSVAINSRGQALAGLLRQHTALVASRSAAGRWARPAGFSCQAPGWPCTSAHVAINARGDAVAAWTVGGESDHPWAEASTVIRKARHRWSEPRTIPGAMATGIGITDRGMGLLAWDSISGLGAFVAPVRAAEPAMPSQRVSESYCQLDVLGDGRAAALGFGPGQAELLLSRRRASGAWMPAERIPLPDTQQYAPHARVGLAKDGTTIVVWATDSLIQAIEYRPAQGWSAVKTLASSAGVGLPSLAMNDRGQAVVGWTRFVPDERTPFSERPEAMYAVTRSAAGAWSAPTRLSATNTVPAGGQVAIDARGRVYAAWAIQPPDDLSTTLGLRAAVGTISGAWSKPIRLSNHHVTSYAPIVPTLAASGLSHAIIGWGRPAQVWVTR